MICPVAAAWRPAVGAAGRASIKHRLFTTSKSRRATWGFIGLGRMGYPMAKNLRAKIPRSDKLIVYDINKDATKRFAQEVGVVTSSWDAAGGDTKTEAATSPGELAAQSDNIITVLPEPSHVRSVIDSILEEQSPCHSSGQERLFIDCSTIDPFTSRAIASKLQDRGQGQFVDAPMSGGVVGAQAATLTFMVGASLETFDRAKPMLLMMGRSVHHCGEQGAGVSAKLANNYLLAVMNIATAEAMNLGIQCGLDAKVLSRLINASTGRNWCSEVNNPVPGVVDTSPASRGYSGGFGVSLMAKDLRLAATAARKAGARLELHDQARSVYERLDQDQRFKGHDFSIVYQYLAESNKRL